MKNPYFTTPLSVKRLEGFLRERATDARARMRGTSQTEDDRDGRTEWDERARDQTDGPGAVASAPARIDAEEFNAVHVPFVYDELR